MGLFAGAHSSMITYAFVTERNGKVTSAQIVREQRFMFAAFGHWPSIVNPSRENLFVKHNVDSCFLTADDYGKINGHYCVPFQNLWKIRFQQHPYEYDLEGWSNGHYRPSSEQMKFLNEEYGIQNILTDYIYGDSLFKLLRDVQDQSWINTYSALAADKKP